MAQQTQLTVISSNKFSELGIVSTVHPEGYIYFAENNDAGKEAADGHPVESTENDNYVTHEELLAVSANSTLENNTACHADDGKHPEVDVNLLTTIRKRVSSLEHRLAKKSQASHSNEEFLKLTQPKRVYSPKTKHVTKEIDSSSDDIVQNRPPVPEGSYVRRRNYNATHAESWQIKLNSLGCISCHFRQCRFLAMSVKDMHEHFRFCIGDSSFAKFRCSICGGVVTTQEILEEHIARSHQFSKKRPRKSSTTLTRPNILRRKSYVPPHSLSVPVADPFIAPTVGFGDRKVEAVELPSYLAIRPICKTIENATLTPLLNCSTPERVNKLSNSQIKFKKGRKILKSVEKISTEFRVSVDSEQVLNRSSSDEVSVILSEPGSSRRNSQVLVTLSGSGLEDQMNSEKSRTLVTYSRKNTALEVKPPCITNKVEEEPEMRVGSLKRKKSEKALATTSRRKKTEILEKQPLKSKTAELTKDSENSSTRSSTGKRRASKSIANETDLKLDSEKDSSLWGSTIDTNSSVTKKEGDDGKNSSNENQVVAASSRSILSKWKPGEICEEKFPLELKSGTHPASHERQIQPTNKKKSERKSKECKLLKMVKEANTLGELPILYHEEPCSSNILQVQSEKKNPSGEPKSSRRTCAINTVKTVISQLGAKISRSISVAQEEESKITEKRKTNVGKVDAPATKEVKNLYDKKCKAYSVVATPDGNEKEVVDDKPSSSIGKDKESKSKRKVEASSFAKRRNSRRVSKDTTPNPLGTNAEKLHDREKCGIAGSVEKNGSVADSSSNAICEKRVSQGSRNESLAVENQLRRKRPRRLSLGSESGVEAVPLAKIKKDICEEGSQSCEASSRAIPIREKSQLDSSSEDEISLSERIASAESENRKNDLQYVEEMTPLKRKVGRPRKVRDCGNEPAAESSLQVTAEIKDGKESFGDESIVKKRGRGRPKRPFNPNAILAMQKAKGVVVKKEPKPLPDEVTCGKCKQFMKGHKWDKHNSLIHAGLGWISDEEPFDPTQADSKEVLNRIRTAFRLHCKSATCDLCGTVKKSFLGFHAHVTLCGKSEVDRMDSMTKCEICGKAVMPYSMSSHMKIHTEEAASELIAGPPSKRRSAVKALSTLQSGEDKKILCYKKGDEIPNECNAVYQQLIGSWRKCQREGCGQETATFKQHCEHYFNCPTLPGVFYFCCECFHIGMTEEDVKRHNCADVEDEFQVFSDEDDPEEDMDSKKKRLRSRKEEIPMSIEESDLKRRCISREHLRIDKGRIHERAFELELERQKKLLHAEKEFQFLTTRLEDWRKLSEEESQPYMPPMKTSFYLKVTGSAESQKVPAFHTVHSNACIAGFAGGPIQTLAWCPIDIDRSGDAHQYLALSTSSEIDGYPWIRTNSVKTALLQIWNVGALYRRTGDKAKMAVGIAMDFGELWDIAWAPSDTSLPETCGTLARIGLIATACHDGKIRIFSVSCPCDDSLPSVYKVRPSVELTKESTGADGCLRVSWGEGNGGVICGGFVSGKIALWYLSTLSSSRTSKCGSTYLLNATKVFLAHSSPVTCVSLSPADTCLVATGGTDRKLYIWNSKHSEFPMRTETATPEAKLKWMRHWPMQIFHVDDLTASWISSKGCKMFAPSIKVCSYVKDISVSDWSLISAYGVSGGELIIRQHCDPFYEQKRSLETVVPAYAKCSKPTGSFRSAEENNVTISFADEKKIPYDTKRSLSDFNTSREPAGADINLTSVDKVAINPNYMTFDHVAVGYHCGFFRLVKIKHVTNRVELITRQGKHS